MDTQKLGELGEKIACEYLVNKGYRILGKNYRISFGEIDVIVRKRRKLFARDDRTIHFVEVKTIINLSNHFFPEDRVDHKKQRKLIRLCEIWLEKNQFPKDQPYQIDVIGVTVNSNIKKASLCYLQNVITG